MMTPPANPACNAKFLSIVVTPPANLACNAEFMCIVLLLNVTQQQPYTKNHAGDRIAALHQCLLGRHNGPRASPDVASVLPEADEQQRPPLASPLPD